MAQISDLAARFYEIVNGEGDLGEVLSQDFQFGIMKGFPCGGNQDGLDATNSFFEKIGPLFSNFEVHPQEYVPQDDMHLIVKGFYRATGAETGQTADFETVHFWTSDGDKLIAYKHYCDTGILSEILDHKVPK